MKKNLLKSLSFICLGVIFAIVFTSASLLVYVPSPPGKPQLVDVQKDQCTIRYMKPKDDGGAPIYFYSIEYKYDWADKWVKVRAEITELAYTVRDLIEGERVQFRVRAINMAGWSEPSEPSDRITLEDVTNSKK